MRISDLRKQIKNKEVATTIISIALKCTREQVLLLREISEKTAKKILKMAALLGAGIPLAYQTKNWHFYNLPIHVNKHVLIPRYDTETIVTAVLGAIDTKNKKLKILDLCTGSGCIAIALAKHTAAQITASDISKNAINIAAKNAELNDVSIEFIQSDMFDEIAAEFDIIACNPPYIATDDIGKYDKTILVEPRIALDGGVDGLDFYREIATEAPMHLTNGGRLFLEIDHDQASAVKNLLQAANFRDIKVIKDICGANRVISATRG